MYQEERVPNSLGTLPFDVLSTIAERLHPHELVTLCYVSKLFYHTFIPILWRNLKFEWPVTNKYARFGGKRLVKKNFTKYLVALELELPMRNSVACSLPVYFTRFVGILRYSGKFYSNGLLTFAVTQERAVSFLREAEELGKPV